MGIESLLQGLQQTAEILRMDGDAAVSHGTQRDVGADPDDAVMHPTSTALLAALAQPTTPLVEFYDAVSNASEAEGGRVVQWLHQRLLDCRPCSGLELQHMEAAICVAAPAAALVQKITHKYQQCLLEDLQTLDGVTGCSDQQLQLYEEVFTLYCEMFQTPLIARRYDSCVYGALLETLWRHCTSVWESGAVDAVQLVTFAQKIQAHGHPPHTNYSSWWYSTLVHPMHTSALDTLRHPFDTVVDTAVRTMYRAHSSRCVDAVFTTLVEAMQTQSAPLLALSVADGRVVNVVPITTTGGGVDANADAVVGFLPNTPGALAILRRLQQLCQNTSCADLQGDASTVLETTLQILSPTVGNLDRLLTLPLQVVRRLHTTP
uniref:Dual specificity protein phosphatase 6 n=1 Tax=Lygus hesperus TaxID=30085 RepID=A0A0A9YMX3_LYGHE